MVMETGLPPTLPSLARVNISLTDAGIPLLSLPILPSQWDGDASGVYLMACQTNVQFLTFKTFAYL